MKCGSFKGMKEKQLLEKTAIAIEDWNLTNFCIQNSKFKVQNEEEKF